MRRRFLGRGTVSAAAALFAHALATASAAETGEAPDCQRGLLQGCDGQCVPAYFLGDGTCDDGSAFPANLDCPELDHDLGDCPNPNSEPTCQRDVVLRATTWANEIGWRLTRLPEGEIIADRPPGTYPSAAPTSYRESYSVVAGDYRLVTSDSFGDGWHGGAIAIVAPDTDAVVVGPYSGPQTSNKSYDFSISCEAPPTCLLGVSAVEQTPATDTGESVGVRDRALGWSLANSVGWPIAVGAPIWTGASFEVSSGNYNLTTWSIGGLGWRGAAVDVWSQPLGGGAVRMLGRFGTQSATSIWTLPVDCDDLAKARALAQEASIQISTSPCTLALVSTGLSETVALEVRLVDADSWKVALGAKLEPGQPFTKLVPVSTGTWLLSLNATPSLESPDPDSGVVVSPPAQPPLLELRNGDVAGALLAVANLGNTLSDTMVLRLTCP